MILLTLFKIDVIKGNNIVVVSCGGKLSGKTFSVVGNRNWESEEIGTNDALLMRTANSLLGYMEKTGNSFSIRASIQSVKSGIIVDLLKKSKYWDSRSFSNHYYQKETLQQYHQ